MSDEKQMIVKLAFVYTQNGDWYKAIEEYRKILLLEPTNATMYNSIGDCYARKGDDQDALDSYWKARELYFSQGNSLKAASVEKKLAKLNLDRLDPKHKVLVRTLQKTAEADQMVQEGRLEEALAQYRQLIEAEPSNYSYREKLAGLFLENAQVTEAAEEFRTIAFAHLEAGHLDPAKLYAGKSAELDSDNPAQVRLECSLAEASGDHSKTGEFQERLAKSEFESGRYEIALDALQKARDAGRTGLDLLQGKTLLALKMFPEARTVFQKLNADQPDDEAVLDNLLILDEAAKDWPAALTHVNTLLAKHPDDNGLLLRGAKIHMQSAKSVEAAQLYMRLAGLAFKDGHYDMVLAYFQAILAFQPENMEVLKKKAELLFKLGKKTETVAAYRELEKHLLKKAPEEARKIAVLVNRIQSLPDHPGKGTLH
jgi:tetratricopeptide (TPR) repeat protein